MKFLSWLKRIALSAFNAIKGLLVDLYQNAESVIILSFSAIGLTTILAELPYHYAMPAFIDGTMIIPVLSVLTILALITIMQWRMNHGTQQYI